MRHLRLGFVALLLCAPVASSAPYLQYAVDASRTGATIDPGPAGMHVAFNTTASSDRDAAVPWGSFPLVIGGAVYALQGFTPPNEQDELAAAEVGLGTPGPAFIERIDLATARREELVDLGDDVLTSGFVSDGTRLFLIVNNEVHAYYVVDGAPAWNEPYTVPDLSPAGSPEMNPLSPMYSLCNLSGAANGVLYLPCHQVPRPNHEGTQRLTMSRPFVLALDAETGRQIWLRPLEPHSVGPTPEGELSAFAMNYSPGRLTVGEGRVFVSVRGLPATSIETRGVAYPSYGIGSLYAIDAARGNVVWRQPLDSGYHDEVAGEPTGLGERAARSIESAPVPPALLFAPGVLYVKQHNLQALDPATGEELWRLRLAPDDAEPEAGHALALYADRLFATAFGTVLAIDIRTHAIEWATRLPEGETWHGVEGMLVAGGKVHASASSRRIFSFEAETGAILDQFDIGGSPLFGIGEGIMAVLAADGRVFVLGSTPAAILPRIDVSDLYPAPSEPVTLDLSRTRAGVLDGITEFRVDWGDGTLQQWTTESRFKHAYAATGERTITVAARNGAGQEAEASVLLDVGGTRPVPETFLQKQFSAENQERTFFILGLLVTALLALMTAARVRRRRSRLQLELDAIEAVHSGARDNPMALEAALAERRAHVRGLLADGKVDPAEAGVLERRIDELGAAGRLDAIDEKFGFLSVGMARALRGMLADGRIQRWEREHFIQALQNDKYLTPAQKSRVRQQVDAWFKQDASGQRV